ncbi:MAG TPA: HEAT repeat domain-containing protein [Kofleriaceae bacterium]|nr:HEAT repeat domain-containing protein [Kofleriaceae bacterium]
MWTRKLAVSLALALAALPAPAWAWDFDWAGHVEVDAEGLASSDVQKRIDAVTELGKYDIALTEKHLMKALSDEDERVRHAAAKALGQGGSTAAVPVLIDWLSNFDPKTKQVAAGALGDIGGPEATAALTRTLGDADSTVRQQAVKALGAIGRRGNPAVVIALIPRLEDDKADVRIATITQLEELGDRRAVIPLVARFGDTALEPRKAAVRAVGRLGDKSAVPALIRLMNDPAEDVRLAAVGALGSLGAIDAIDALTEQLNTGSQNFRQKVAYALGQIAGTPGAGKAGEDAMRTLVENLAVNDQRQGAREALRVAGRAAVPALVLHLQGRLKGDPATAVALLAEAADPRATATLAAELERGRVAIPLVLRALGATGDPQALVPVLRALASKDPAIRVAAMESLRPLVGSDARAGDVLIEHLTDDDLEIRVLAAEYLGILGVSAATPKLAALAGPGNPTRLRRAAIDSLGLIGRADGTTALLAVLREGPPELHPNAATSLSYIADPNAIQPLIALAKADRGPTRHHIVRALGATLRAKRDPAARKLLRELANDGSIKISLAAIAGLAAAKDPADAPFLRSLVQQGSSDRRRAAAWALGEMRDTDSVDALAAALGTKDDRLTGDAAWALGEILAATPTHARASTLVDRWLYLGKHGSWAAAIDSTGALARTLWALPRDKRGTLLGNRRGELVNLAFHRSRLVRINVAQALGSLAGDDDAAKTLAQLLRDDPSPHVRIAAAKNLARVGGTKVAPAFKQALDTDSDAMVRDAIKAAQTAVAAPVARTEWRVFQVVDPGADDAPVRQEQYFVHTADGIVWASYTDARGELASEHVPAGDLNVWPASRESEY